MTMGYAVITVAAVRRDLATRSHRVPNFVTLAEALGCAAIRCQREDEVEMAIARARAINDRPVSSTSSSRPPSPPRIHHLCHLSGATT